MAALVLLASFECPSYFSLNSLTCGMNAVFCPMFFTFIEPLSWQIWKVCFFSDLFIALTQSFLSANLIKSTKICYAFRISDLRIALINRWYSL